MQSLLISAALMTLALLLILVIIAAIIIVIKRLLAWSLEDGHDSMDVVIIPPHGKPSRVIPNRRGLKNAKKIYCGPPIEEDPN